MKAFSRICDILDKAAILVVGATLSGIFLLTTGNAVLRYFFKTNLLWAYDLLRVLFLFVVFFGISVVFKRKNHARYSFIDNFVTGTVALVLREVIHALSALFFLVVVFESARLVVNTRAQIMPASQISAMWLYLPLLFGCGICLAHAVYFLVDELQDKDGRSAGPDSEEAAR